MRRQALVGLLVGMLVTVSIPACTPSPDLVPANPGGWAGFCDLDDQGRLVVYVTNQGRAGAGASTTMIEWFLRGGTVELADLSTPQIGAGEGPVELEHVELPVGCYNPDCDFRITVDAENQVNEYNEANNTIEGICIG